MQKSRLGSRRRLWIAALAALAAAELAGQTPTTTISERVDVTVATVAVHLPGAGEGPPPRAEAIAVFEDGRPRRVLSVRRWLERRDGGAGGAPPVGGSPPSAPEDGAPPEFTLYVDLSMASFATLRAVARQMGGGLAELALAGPFSLAVADPEPRLRLEGSRDPVAVRAALEALVRAAPARGALEVHRSALVHGSDWGRSCADILALAAEEARLIAQARQRLLAWLAARSAGNRPRVLFLVGGAFDPDPTGFYERHAPRDRGGAPRVDLARELSRLAQQREDEELARILTAWGWLAFPIALSDVGFSDFGGAQEGGTKRWRAFALGAAAPSQASPTLFVDLGGSWRPLAERSGGRLIRTAKDLDAARRRLDETVLVSYERPGLAAARRFALEVRRTGEGGERLAAPAWVEEGAPDAINAVRAAGAGADFDERGGLAVGARVLAFEATREGERRLRLELAYRSTTPGIEPSGEVQVAMVATGGDEPTRLQVVAAPGASPGRIVVEVRLRAGGEALGVALEDPVSGLWGTVRLALPGGER